MNTKSSLQPETVTVEHAIVANRSVYDQLAGPYFEDATDENGKLLGYNCQNQLRTLTDFLSQTRPLSGSTFYDLGCGFGGVIENLHPLGIEYFGFDFSEKRIECAKILWGDKGEFSIQDILQLDIVEKADLVWCVAVFYHLPSEKWKYFLDSVYQLLRPGGYAFLVHKIGDGFQFRSCDLFDVKGPACIWEISSRELFLSLIEDSGLEIVHETSPDLTQMETQFFVKRPI